MNNVYFSSHRLTLGQERNPSPEMSINSDISVGTKKVLLYSSNSTKFFPKEKEYPQEYRLNISEDMSFNNEQSPINKLQQGIPSPQRSAIRNKGKSGTSFFFNPENASELNEEAPLRTEGKKKTIKYSYLFVNSLIFRLWRCFSLYFFRKSKQKASWLSNARFSGTKCRYPRR